MVRVCITSSFTIKTAGKLSSTFEKKGFKVIQSGKFGEDEFYYLDTDKAFWRDPRDRKQRQDSTSDPERYPEE